jgi:hypothetical protein
VGAIYFVIPAAPLPSGTVQAYQVYSGQDNLLKVLNGKVTGGITTAPVTATSTGVAGQVKFTATGIYICITPNVWIKCTGATF